MAIYRWWKVERPANQKRRDELLHKLYGERRRMKFVPTENPKLQEIQFDEFEGDEIALDREFRELEHKIETDEDVMLMRLMKIRKSIWT